MEGFPAPFHAGDVVRLTRPLAGAPAGSQGEVLGRYVDRPELIVRLWDGGVQRVPVDALEVIERPEERSGPAA